LYVPALHKAQRGIPTLVAAFYMIIGVMISFFVAGLATGALAMPRTISVWALLLTLSLVGTVIAFLALMSGLRILGPVRTSIMATIEPFFTAVLGVIALGEKFTLTLLSGGMLIATAVILLQWSGRTRRDAEPAMESG
jgi:drug/metabolite transporter (DMT)-like permease